MKLIFSIFIFFGLTIVANAGFLSSLLGSVVANDLSKSSRTNVYLSPDRAKKINTYLWNIHKSKKYDKQYKFYINELLNSSNVDYLDTVAWIYYDNNNTKKAIEIYETKILPWLKFENNKKRKSLERNYKIIKGLKDKRIDYDRIIQKLLLSKDKVKSDELVELKLKNKILQGKIEAFNNYKIILLFLGILSILSLLISFFIYKRR